MLALSILLAAQAQVESKAWYGPETATFAFAFAGNPYDPAVSDVKVQFIDGKGRRLDRLAYFDPEEMAWKAVLVADQPGKYKPVMFRNGLEVEAIPEPALVELGQKPLSPGFVRVDPISKNRFRTDDGALFFPLGMNLAWHNDGLPDIPEMFKTMKSNGMNWTRIWATQRDGKDPWISKDGSADADRLVPDSFAKWDQIVTVADQSNIKFQFVMFDHSSLRTGDPTWESHPWNKEKGGFLTSPAEFFGNAEAKRRTKMWLRYAVARWGHSSSIMAWELLNEVEADAPEATAWHKEMADFVRSIDPYGHMVTTGRKLDEAMDYYQPHLYPEMAAADSIPRNWPTDKPLFLGEFGMTPIDKPDQRSILRDRIWGGIMAGHAGAGAYWSWEVVHKQSLYNEFGNAAKLILETAFAKHSGARPAIAQLATPGQATIQSIREVDWLMARVVAMPGKSLSSLTLTALALPAGNYKLSVYNLETAASNSRFTKVAGIDHQETFTMPGSDALVVFERTVD